MNHYFYAVDLHVVARELKNTCDWRCTCCGKQCRRPGEFWLGWDYELSVAHISQDYDAEAVQVACLCAACHLAHDAPLVWIARRRQQRWLRRASGQLELFAARG